MAPRPPHPGAGAPNGPTAASSQGGHTPPSNGSHQSAHNSSAQGTPPPSQGGSPLGQVPPTVPLSSSSAPPVNYPPHGSPSMGPPHHMMYNSPKMGHPNPQGSAPPGAPYGGQGGYPGPYGPRPSYSHNHYPPYGARPGMYPGSYGGPYPPQGWGSQGAVQNTPQGVTPNQPHHGNAKGTLGPRHGLLPQASPHFGGQRIPHPPGKGYPPGPPGSYNGPPGSTPAAIYNGPGTPGPAGQANNYSGGTNYTNSSPGNVASNFNSAAGSNGPPPGPSSANGPAASSKPSSPVTNTNNNPLPPTGPDGVPMLDETSQQSTLSQSSDRSDGTTGGRQTPKTSFVPQGGPGGSYPSHHQGGPPGSPHRSAPSPGLDGGYGSGSGGNPGWQNQHRIASSPAGTASGPSSHSMFNSITPGSLPASTVGPPGSARGPPSTSSSPSPGPPMTSGVGGVCGTETKTSAPPTPGSKAAKAAAARTEGLMRLYEMDDHPERKMFLDKLLGFMEERGTAIAQCPTISKNPLDLFKLYIYTKEKGGFMECTKNKTWKDIAAQLGIGASSSGAYTLKKHYGKNLLPYECQFDRGGIDPAPLLAQVEAQTKKKPKSSTPTQPPPAPSPGSQDSRDSSSNYSGSNSQDAYNSTQPSGGSLGGMPPAASNSSPGAQNYPGYNYSPSTPATPDGRPAAHGQGGYPHPNGNFGSYPPPPGSNSAGGPAPPPSAYHGYGGSVPPRPSWPNPSSGAMSTQSGYMGPPHSNGTSSPGPSQQSSGDIYPRGGYGGYGPRPGFTGTTGPPPPPPASAGQPYPSTQSYDQFHKTTLGATGLSTPISSVATTITAPSSSSATPPTATAPSSGSISTPGGLAKQGMLPPTQRPQSPQTFSSSSNTTVPNSSGITSSSPSSKAPNPSGPTQSRPGPAQLTSSSFQQRPPISSGPGWQNRFPQPSGASGSWSNGSAPHAPMGGSRPAAPGWGNERQSFSSQYNGSWGTGISRARGPYRPEMPRGPRPAYSGARGRDMIFPHGSVESSHPLMMKRRKHTKIDVQPVDGWRVVMSLKSGLLMESTWALDVLNILLFDDNAFTYFGLGNLPGLFEAVLEQWRASLVSMFGITEELGISSVKEDATNSRRRACEATREGKRKWFQRKYHKRLVNEGALFAQADLNEEEDTKSINSAEEEYDLGLAAKIDHLDSRMVLEAGGNYTKRPRFSEEDVQFDERNDELFIMDGQRNWDLTNEPYEGSSLHWEMGGGDNTNHLVEAFSGSLEIVPFVRILEELKPATSIKEETAGPSKEAFAGENRIPTTAGIVKTEPGEEGAAEEANQEEEHEPQEDIVDKITRLTGIVLRDPEIARKRLNEDCLENECYMRDEPSLIVTSDKQEFIGKRAVCVSTILRNLSFVPGNEFEFSKNATFLRIAGQLLLLYHWYPKRTTKQRNYDRGDDDETAESCSSLTGGTEWWWESLHVIRENVMVILANIAGSLELKQFDEDVVAPILNGLLEWSVSSASYAQDPFPNVGPNSPVSPQRLAIEALCKVCLQDSNVDLILSTPPYSRIVKLTRILAKKLYRYEDQVLREFSINLLYYFSAADSGVARAIALADQTVGLMLGFIEQAEQNALVVAQQHGVNALRDNPDSMGTSLDMLRRAASTLLSLSRHPDNIPLFVKHEERLLSLVMSQILDQGVAAILSNVLFNIGVEQQRSIDTMTKKKEEGIKALKANDVKRETDGVEHGKHENDDFAAKNSKELSEDAVNSVESVSYSNYVTKVTQKKTPVQPQSFTNSLGNGESSTNISSASPIGSTIETAVTPS